MVMRLAVAAAAGLVLGLERQRGAHPAGARTHLLVAVGACLFTLGGAYGFLDIDRVTPWDPARIAAQVASGIGFIGAGAILQDGTSTRGLTTAATLWISGALGVCIGAGLIVETLAAEAIVLVALTALTAINDRRTRGRVVRLRLSVTARGQLVPQPFWSELMAVADEVEEVRRGTTEDAGPADDLLEVVFTRRDVHGQDDLVQLIEPLMSLPTVRTVDLQRID